MADYERERSAASEALVALRKAMGKTQQTFAVEVLNTAIGTIARYETTDPPRGDVLLRLRDIARDQGLSGLSDRFQSIWLEEVHKALGPDVRTFLIADGSPARGLLVASLEGIEALRGARTFLAILQQLGSANAKFRQNAISALSSLQEAARRFDDPGHHEQGDAILTFLAESPANSIDKRAKRRKHVASGKAK